MDAELLEERTLFKIGVPARVERVRLAPDSGMPTDADDDWVYQSEPDDFSVGRPFAGVCREHVSAAEGMPVTLDQASAALAGVPVSGPPPEAVPQSPVHFLERPLRRDVAVIVGPAPNHGIELTNQVGLAVSAIPANHLPHLLQEGVRVFPGGLDEQLAAEFAEVLSEEVESGFDVCDAGFLGRELQAPVAQELINQWLDFIFQQFLGAAGDDEVVRIPNEVYFGAGRPPGGELLLEQSFQSVECQVGQRGRDNPALRCACLS